MVEFEDNLDEQFARIKVVGVGGGGNNAINRMVNSKLVGMEFISGSEPAPKPLVKRAPICNSVSALEIPNA